MLRLLLGLVLVAACARESTATPTTPTPSTAGATTTPTTPSAASTTTPAAASRPTGWYLPSGRYHGHGVRLARGNDRVELHGAWALDVREEGTRHFVDLALGREIQTWEVVDRLGFHLCATAEMEPRPGIRIVAGTPLYLRDATDAEITVAPSPAITDATFRLPRSAASLDACVAAPLVPSAEETEAQTVGDVHVPAGTPILVRGLGTNERRSWAFDAGENRWWLVDIAADTDTAAIDADLAAATHAAAPVATALPREAIRSVIRTKESEYRACYEWRLGSAPSLEGRMQIRFVIGPTGNVEAVSTADGPGSLDLLLETCIARLFARLQFPQPGGAGVVIVTYPLVFAQSDQSTPPPRID